MMDLGVPRDKTGAHGRPLPVSPTQSGWMPPASLDVAGRRAITIIYLRRRRPAMGATSTVPRPTSNTLEGSGTGVGAACVA